MGRLSPIGQPSRKPRMTADQRMGRLLDSLGPFRDIRPASYEVQAF